ncbi:MAG: sialidase family protein [Acidimicrobiales bacterium]
MIRSPRPRLALAVVAFALATLATAATAAATTAFASPAATTAFASPAATTAAATPARNDSVTLAAQTLAGSSGPGNVLASTDNSPITANDTPTLVQDPANAADLVIVNRVDRPGFAAVIEYSTNSGHSWHASALQAPPESSYQAALSVVPHTLYAPEALFDAKGTLYVVFVTLSGPGNQPDGVWVESSTDGGQSFRPPTAVAGPESYEVSATIDQASGKLFVSWLQAKPFLCVLCFPATGYPIVVSDSTDGGQTWSTPLRVSDPGLARIGAPTIALDALGNPYVLYYDYEGDTLDWGNLPGHYRGTFTLYLARSTNGGATYGPGELVNAAIFPTRRFIPYLAPRPGLAIGESGIIAVAWPDARSGTPQVLLETSTDGGAAWTAPVVISKDGGQGQFQRLPAVGIAPNGRIDVGYYGGSGSTTDFFVSSSVDGGRTFSEPTQVSTKPSNLVVGPPGSPYFSAQADFGSKNSLVSLDHQVLVAWTDTRNGAVFDGRQQIYFASLPAAAPAGAGGPGALLLGVVVAGGFLALVGLGLLIAAIRSRRGKRSRVRLAGPPPLPAPSDLPPPPPPLTPSPGQV